MDNVMESRLLEIKASKKYLSPDAVLEAQLTAIVEQFIRSSGLVCGCCGAAITLKERKSTDLS